MCVRTHMYMYTCVHTHNIIGNNGYNNDADLLGCQDLQLMGYRQ